MTRPRYEGNEPMKTGPMRIRGWWLCGLIAAVAAGAQPPAHVVPQGQPPGDDTVFDDGFGESADVVRARRGFAIAPVPLDMVGADAVQVGLGSYIVNASAACAECHTNPPYLAGGDPYSGQPKQVNAANYLAGGRAFGPVVRSRNITPSLDNGLPAGLTFEQFEEAVRHGRNFHCQAPDPSSCPPLQNMPWPVYRNMSTTDLRAVYAYLGVVPHAEPATPAR